MEIAELKSLAYITECLLATVEDTCQGKYSKFNKERHRIIAIDAVDLCLRCKITADLAENLNNTRLSKVIKLGFETWHKERTC